MKTSIFIVLACVFVLSRAISPVVDDRQVPISPCGTRVGYITVPNPYTPSKRVYLDKGTTGGLPDGIFNPTPSRRNAGLFEIDECKDVFDITCSNCGTANFVGVAWYTDGSRTRIRRPGESVPYLMAIEHASTLPPPYQRFSRSSINGKPSLSRIWSINESNKLSAAWVNADGTKVQLVFAQKWRNFWGLQYGLPIEIIRDFSEHPGAAKIDLVFVPI